jgi:hypothetical protein
MGQALLMVPFDIPITASLKLAGIDPHAPQGGVSQTHFRVMLYAFFPIINAGALVLIYRLLSLLIPSALSAFAGMVTLLFGSTLLWHFQNAQENTLLLLLTCFSMIRLIEWRRSPGTQRPHLAFAAMGLSCIVRMTSVANVAALLLFVPLTLFLDAKCEDRLSIVRLYVSQVMKGAVPIFGGFLILERLFHWWRFGTVWGQYKAIYADVMKQDNPLLESAFPFNNNVLDGLLGPLFSPGASIFIYDPLLLLGIGVGIFLWKTLTPEVRACYICSALLCAGIIGGYARFYNWSGQSSWGHRFTTTPVFLIVMLAVPLLIEHSTRTRHTRWLRRGVGLFVVSFVVQCCSIVYPSWIEEVQLSQTRVNLLPADEAAAARESRLFSQAGEFYLARRIVNIAADMSGNFVRWELDRDAAGEAVGLHAPMLVPFLPFRSLPRTLALLIHGLWFCLGASLVLLLGVGFAMANQRELRASLPATHGEKKKGV